jgi:hypothetical protein
MSPINSQPHNFTKGISACRTQLLGGTRMVECHEEAACKWSVSLGYFKFCEHPSARQIVQPTRL